MWRERERGEGRGDARLRGRGRSRGGRSGARRSSGSTYVRGDRADARAPVRRSGSSIAGRERSGSEILEDVPDVETIVVPVGGGRPHRRDRGAAAATARVIGVEPEARRAAPLRRSRRASVSRSTPALDRRRPERAVRRARPRSRSLQDSRRRGRARDGGRDRGRVPLPLRAREARVRAGRRGGGRRGARRQGRSERPDGPSSSRAATSRPKTAAAILASR